METFGITNCTNYALQTCCRWREGRDDGLTDGVDPILDLLSLKRNRKKTHLKFTHMFHIMYFLLTARLITPRTNFSMNYLLKLLSYKVFADVKYVVYNIYTMAVT